MPAPIAQAESKPAPKKPVVQHRKPATVNYADKTYGVTFEYPRRYAIETGRRRNGTVVQTNAIPMNFVQPGGIALAAVELPETSYVKHGFLVCILQRERQQDSHRRSMHRVRRSAAQGDRASRKHTRARTFKR